MSRDAKVSFVWGDGEHDFRLGIGQWDELDEKTKCGPQELLARLLSGTWRPNEIRETIRIGLIGGGMKSVPALSLVGRYFDGDVPAEHIDAAIRILHAGIFGPAEDNVGKKSDAAPGPSESSQTDASVSPSSTETAPPSESPSVRSSA